MNPREVAFLALLVAMRGEGFLDAFLRASKLATDEDAKLARAIAAGSMRMQRTLDYVAEQLAEKNKLKLKLKERALLRTALYQLLYMRVPAYAVVDESVKLAKTYCHSMFVRFLNALLRKAGAGMPEIPKNNWGIYYSYPQLFIDTLVEEQGSKVTREILEMGNEPPVLMARERGKGTLPKSIEKVELDPKTYVQNVTPALLMNHLAKGLEKSPERILDLCAAPGGKLLFAADLFPQAKLFANDVKQERLQENCEKYGLDVEISIGLGEEYPDKELFDLIILDVPCSNSGVLNKRPEARWRLTEENLQQLETLQRKLLTRAKEILADGGQIWYLTCSILRRENQDIVEQEGFTVLPDKSGKDGGFCACLGSLG